MIANIEKHAYSMQLIMEIDHISRRILRELAADGRLSNVDLAARVGLSPSACLRRVQEMERRGVIRGYRARLDGQALGLGFLAYVAVGLKTHTKRSQESFEQAMAAAPAVVECHNVTGTVEYLLRVEAADLVAYKHFHTEVLGALPQVASITSYVVLGSPKDARA